MVTDKDLSPLPGLNKCNILSGGLRPWLVYFRPSGARPAHAATEFRDRNWIGGPSGLRIFESIRRLCRMVPHRLEGIEINQTTRAAGGVRSL